MLYLPYSPGHTVPRRTVLVILYHAVQSLVIPAVQSLVIPAVQSLGTTGTTVFGVQRGQQSLVYGVLLLPVVYGVLLLPVVYCRMSDPGGLPYVRPWCTTVCHPWCTTVCRPWCVLPCTDPGVQTVYCRPWYTVVYRPCTAVRGVLSLTVYNGVLGLSVY